MNLEPFIEELAKLLEVPRSALVPDAELADFDNWDSLTKVSLIGFVDEHYKVPMNGAALDSANTVDELANVLTQLARAAA